MCDKAPDISDHKPLGLLLPLGASKAIRDKMSSLAIQFKEIANNGTEYRSDLTDALGQPSTRVIKSALADSFALIVDAHAPFQEMAHLFSDVLPTLAVPNDRSVRLWKAVIVFASLTFDTPTPPLDSQGEQSGSREQVELLRQNQFFIRMATSYGWGTFCFIDRLPDFLDRIASHRMGDHEFLAMDAKEIAQWNSDVERAWHGTARQLSLHTWVGNAIDADRRLIVSRNKGAKDPYPGITRDNLLKCLALVHHFGRLDQSVSEAAAHHSGIAWFRESTPWPSRNRQQMNELTRTTMQIWHNRPDKNASAVMKWLHRLVRQAGKRNISRANQTMFDFLIDLSQMLSKGCSPWAAHSVEAPSQPIKILAIKDYVRDDIERTRLAEAFSDAFHAAFRPGTVELQCIYSDDGKNQDWDTHLWWLERLQGEQSVETSNHLVPNAPKQISKLLDYDILVVEAEYETRFLGPSIIHWLDNALDEVCQVSNLPADNNLTLHLPKRRPQIFVLSRDESAGHSFMCLWLGAQAFASKSRIFGIPGLLTMAHVGRWRAAADNKKLRPNFFSIEGLIPHQRNRLQSRRPEHLIFGDKYDRHWIKSLPKADLHYHIGTSISLGSIKAMSANTTGRSLSHSGTADQGDPMSTVIENVCKIVLLSNLSLKHTKEARQKEKFELLWAVARFLLLPSDKDGKVVDNSPPEFGSIDQTIEWLVRSDRPIRRFEACSFLVTALHIFDCFLQVGAESASAHATIPLFSSDAVKARFLQDISKPWFSLHLISSLVKDVAGQGLAMSLVDLFAYLFKRIDQNWSDPFSRSSVRETLSTLEASDPRKLLAHLATCAIKNGENAFAKIARAFDATLVSTPGGSSWIVEAHDRFKARKAEYVYAADQAMVHVFENNPRAAVAELCATPQNQRLRLEELVVLPDSNDAFVDHARRTLPRYLVGSGLLGAEHLQFPENILLAGLDIARQNVQDNVVYSEVRCATTGYCQGGLNVYDATDLLALGFDFGALLFGGWRAEEREAHAQTVVMQNEYYTEDVIRHWCSGLPQRWVRTNILLGAKRHKEKEIKLVVELVKHYLERGQEVADFRGAHTSLQASHDVPGRWWERCAVVGFDLSGNESSKIERLESLVEPLFETCASITIHAGEAMTADSIWNAVHHLGAQRIGHGLRLRESAKLLEHCVRRGICMELCPISNRFTNIFVERPYQFQRLLPAKSFRDEYPINDFLSAGLDVCLNTDNRSLHVDGTLSDEYLCAARLSGGLTRWDVLRICKAGFKNAFLPKEQIAALLRHVEYEIYKIASEHSGENDFPSIQHFRRPTSA
jgi:adenosine deaminase